MVDVTYYALPTGVLVRCSLSVLEVSLMTTFTAKRQAEVKFTFNKNEATNDIVDYEGHCRIANV